jgi:hypothetical protein
VKSARPRPTHCWDTTPVPCYNVGMSEQHEAIREQHRLFGLDRRAARRIAIRMLALLVGLRAVSELAMMWESGSDAQMPIWGMLLVVKVAFWLLVGTVVVGLMIAMWPRRWSSLATILALLAWTVAICSASWDYNVARQALADASNPATSPRRLSDLVHFNGIQAGYRLDNRLASNPNTPPEALRELSQRDQLGTQMCLARNPNTPPDVLRRLAAPSIQ